LSPEDRPQRRPSAGGRRGFGRRTDRRPSSDPNRRDPNRLDSNSAPPNYEGQAGAVNRSRPLYDKPAGPQGRFRRPGGPRNANGRPNNANGQYRRPSNQGRPGASRFAEDERQGPPPLPSDPREAALRILFAVDTRSAFSDRMLDAAHSAATGPDERDRALLHELVKGTLRWRGRLDWVLDRVVHMGIDKVQPWIRNVLRLGAYQILFLDRVPPHAAVDESVKLATKYGHPGTAGLTNSVLRLGAYQILFLDRVPPHAAVDESVKLATKYGHPGTAGLTNSVLRRLADEKDAYPVPEGDDIESLAAWGSHPEWLVERWVRRFGVEATRELMLANNRAARVGLRVNALRGTREALIEKLAAEGAIATPAELSPDLVWLEGQPPPASLEAFRTGWCTAQDESEALVARLVAPHPHERILDLCAAPGGKCTHIAELIGDDGDVWAMERAAQRMQSIEQNLTRLGLHSIHVLEGDGRSHVFPMPFDRVLVDAPCSGLGVLGRRADARWRKGPEVLRELAPVQLDLLAAAARNARPGGVVVYSVCSFEPEETDYVVERFLHQSPQMILESAQGILPDAVVDEGGFMRVFPHVHGCDGAFAARFRKT
jgi:16S rRNA (cytosine967-C5)-methyltransferase